MFRMGTDLIHLWLQKAKLKDVFFYMSCFISMVLISTELVPKTLFSSIRVKRFKMLKSERIEKQSGKQSRVKKI